MKSSRKKRIGLVAVMLTALLSCFTLGATAARYFTETKGKGNVSIAKFHVIGLGDKGDGDTPPSLAVSDGGASPSYAFTVTNDSDVAVTYDVKVVLPVGSPTGVVSFILDNNETKTAEVNGLEYTFMDVGTLAIGDEAKHTLTVSALNFINGVKIEGIAVSVVAEQVNPT